MEFIFYVSSIIISYFLDAIIHPSFHKEQIEVFDNYIVNYVSI